MKKSIIALILIITIFSLIYGTYCVHLYAKEKWDKSCLERGLPIECTTKDECIQDCKSLNKEVWKMEESTLSKRIIDCWCKDKNDNIQQIW